MNTGVDNSMKHRDIEMDRKPAADVAQTLDEVQDNMPVQPPVIRPSLAGVAMNPDVIMVDSDRTCSHIADGNLIYQDIVKRLQSGGANAVESVSENTRCIFEFMKRIETSGPRAGVSMDHAEVTDLVNTIGKVFFLDLGVCEDASPSRYFENVDGSIVAKKFGDNDPLHFNNSVQYAYMKSIYDAKSQEHPSLVIVVASMLKRSPDDCVLCDEFGNWFSYFADPEVVQMGAEPGERGHCISAIGFGANSKERSSALRAAAQEHVRAFMIPLTVALNPPALSVKTLPWSSIYIIGQGLKEWKSISSYMQLDEALHIVDEHNKGVVGLARQKGRCVDNVIDRLGLLSQFVSLCTSLEVGNKSAPEVWSKETALEWAVIMLRNPIDPDEAYNLWRLMVACEHIVEVSGETDRVVEIATHSRQVDDLAGITRRSPEIKIPNDILKSGTEGIQLAQAVANFSVIELRNKKFNPELVGPVSPIPFDHLSASYFNAKKLGKPTRSFDGIRVGKGRSMKPNCTDVFIKRKKARKIKIHVKDQIILISETTLLEDFTGVIAGPINAINFDVGGVVGTGVEFEHIPQEEPRVREGGWRVASHAVVNAIVNGQLGYDAALWLLPRLRSGDVKMSKKSKRMSFLVGSNGCFEDGGIFINQYLDPGVTKRLPTYLDETTKKLWIDIDDNGDLRRVERVTHAILRVHESEKYAGDLKNLRECSVVGEYGIGACV